MIEELKNLVKISTYVGDRKDFVQGGGGNTSVKIDGTIMAIKASGFLLKDVSVDNAFALVDYKKVRDFYSSEQNGNEDIVKSAVVKKDGYKVLKPSIETGFHSLLGKYVIHTHSVYANVITCAKDSVKLLKKYAVGNAEMIHVPYSMPGRNITENIKAQLQNNNVDIKGDKPVCLFLKSHGFVVSANDVDKAIQCHREVNNLLIKQFGEQDSDYQLEKIDENHYTIDSAIFDENQLELLMSENIMDCVLFPDQVVYIQNDKSKIKVMELDKANNRLLFNTNRSETEAIIDTLLAYCYISTTLTTLGYEADYIAKEEVQRLLSNEDEEYRKKLISNSK